MYGADTSGNVVLFIMMNIIRHSFILSLTFNIKDFEYIVFFILKFTHVIKM